MRRRTANLVPGEGVGWALRAADGDCVAARLEQGSIRGRRQTTDARSESCRRQRSTLNPLGKKYKRPREGAFHILAERVGFSSPASRAPCQHAATRLRWSNRVRTPIPSRRKYKRPREGAFHILAERVGFEPTVRENRTPDFESGPFDHSGTSPWRRPLRGCGLYAMGGVSASQQRRDIAARSLKLSCA